MVLAAEIMMSSVQVRPKARFIVAEGNFARFRDPPVCTSFIQVGGGSET